MAISDKTRKVLWGRSGNRCALCKRQLVVDASAADPESVVGEECHIVSAKPYGPRFDPAFPAGRHDEETNLVLLCAVHHKQVDDQTGLYTREKLLGMKQEHEAWVTAALDPAPKFSVRYRRREKNELLFAKRISTGRELLAVVAGACEGSFEHPELETVNEMEEVSAFIQEAQDAGEMFDCMEAGDRVRAAFELTQRIRDLEAGGFLIFGVRVDDLIEVSNNPPAPWPVALVHVVRDWESPSP